MTISPSKSRPGKRNHQVWFRMPDYMKETFDEHILEKLGFGEASPAYCYVMYLGLKTLDKDFAELYEAHMKINPRYRPKGELEK